MLADDTMGWLLLLGSVEFVVLLFLWEPLSRIYVKLGGGRSRGSGARKVGAR